MAEATTNSESASVTVPRIHVTRAKPEDVARTTADTDSGIELSTSPAAGKTYLSEICSHKATAIDTNNKPMQASSRLSANGRQSTRDAATAKMSRVGTYKLSHPITAVKISKKRFVTGSPDDSDEKKISKKSLLTGSSDGTIQIWDVTLPNDSSDTSWSSNMKPLQSIKVAGEVVSMDVCGDYLAVGSTVTQMIDISNDEFPRKIFFAQQDDFSNIAQHQKNLVAFTSNLKGKAASLSPKLVSATVGGKIINLWSMPSWDDGNPMIMKPDSQFTIDGSIESLCTSRSSGQNNAWVGVIAKKKFSFTLHLLSLHKHKQFKQDITLLDKASTGKPHAVFLHSGRRIAIGIDKEIQIWETDSRHQSHAQSLKLEESIANMCFSECSGLSTGYLAVGLMCGDVEILTRKKGKYATNFTISPDHSQVTSAPVTALNFDEMFTWGIVTHEKGALALWQATKDSKDSYKTMDHPTLGMELENEGILDQIEMFFRHDRQDITIHGDDCVELRVPNEICVRDGILAVEVGVNAIPFGPFVFPKGIFPISPIVWLCSVPQATFSMLAELKIPHCFVSQSDKDLEALCLLKADHTKVETTILEQRVIKFEDVTFNNTPKFTPSATNVSIADNHFCMYCVGVTLREELPNIRLCLTIMVPDKPVNHKCYNIYCILHYDLPGCHKLIREQFKGRDYNRLEPEKFQFNTANSYADAGLRIELANTTEAELLGWQVALDSIDKISAKKVNFFDNFDTIPELVAACQTYNTHPPRFVIRVSPENSVSNSKFSLVFHGAKHELKKEILLIRTHEGVYDPPKEKPQQPAVRPFNASSPNN